MTDLGSVATAWMDTYWDADVSLLRHPDDPMRHAVRETAWYALGLLMRGDEDRAWTALREVVAQQFDAPGTPFHGTFARAPEDPYPPDDPTIWIDYDPNWRQFIGCTFALIVDTFGDRAGLRESIRLAAASEPRHVPPSYSNIAMMRAWLDAWNGDVERGEQLARGVDARIRDAGGLDEFNSPTYYGIDLFALDLWSQRPPTPLFASLGGGLLEGLWRDIAELYHPGLKNLCGPWLRSYGMDMTRYLAVLGMYVGALPNIEDDFDHSADLCMGPLVASSRDVAGPFPRVVDRVVAGMHVTARLHEDKMWGALEGGPSGSPQIHPATAHWRNDDGSVGWLRVRSRGPLNAVATESGLRVEVGEHGATLESSDGTKRRLEPRSVEVLGVLE